jgi:hypothetical protein
MLAMSEFEQAREPRHADRAPPSGCLAKRHRLAIRAQKQFGGGGSRRGFTSVIRAYRTGLRIVVEQKRPAA